ncbi:hypothetical protein LWI29_013032 [Acer saccharum]|uniref:Aminotransferase-like plant mobile domain-containing protein n=1 Tax=Acer saccharum TaxID=4024 RepID=A0AA39VR26_ACESA|nr:hypothetical protein LWI29_013032 [Acer saccharum]
MEVVCGSTAVEPPMSPRSPPVGGLDLYGKGDRWLKFRFWRERLACFRAFLFKGFLSDEECDCVTTLLIWLRTSLRSQWWQIMSPFPFAALMDSDFESTGVDSDEVNPGPVDKSVLYDQEKHVSSAVWEGQERGALRCHEHTSKLGEWRLTKRQLELVDMAGFRYLRLIPSISLDNPFISALVERWRMETNTFHFTVGEMTVTLKDVAFLIGLPIDGEPVLGVTYTSCQRVCEMFLGRVPESRYMSGGMVKLSWLKESFSQCPEDAPMEEIECHTRAYLLYLVGSTIFSTTTGNKVPVMYLPLFEDFDKAGKYAWGAAALAFLYRALGKASLRSQSTISGCLTLLQCWSYFHLNIGRPKLKEDPARDHFPFVLRWKGKQSGVAVKHDVAFYRNALDSLKPCDVEWLPYKDIDSMEIPESIKSSLILGRSKTMLICFDKAERHLPDRCLRQHGMFPSIPKDVQQWERKSRGVDSGVDLSLKMESELNEWMDRRLNIVGGDDGVKESEYMDWYLNITRKFVGRPTPTSQFLKTVRFRTKNKRMSAGLRNIACIADAFSTKGLNPQQIESITRIRDTAHHCLGDQIGDAIRVSTTPHFEDGKMLEENQIIVRKTSGKCKLKDDFINCYEASEDSQSQFCGATIEDEKLQLCHGDSEVDHLPIEPGKRARKKQSVRRKPVGKRKKDDSTQCHGASRGDEPQLAGKVDHSQSQHADKQISDSQLITYSRKVTKMM